MYYTVITNIVVFAAVAIPILLGLGHLGVLAERGFKALRRPAWVDKLEARHATYMKWADSKHEAKGFWFKRRKFG